LVHAEGAGNDGAQEDHDAVELAQLVAAQHGEGDGGGDAVEEDGGDETPHEDRHPEENTSQLTRCYGSGSDSHGSALIWLSWIRIQELRKLTQNLGCILTFYLQPTVSIFLM
jgi:hypothetical protein